MILAFALVSSNRRAEIVVATVPDPLAKLLTHFVPKVLTQCHRATCAQTWAAQKQLTLITAFSRDQPDKIYVQHRMREQGALLASLIVGRNAVCLVAGCVRGCGHDVWV